MSKSTPIGWVWRHDLAMLSLTRKSDYALVALSHLTRNADELSSAREIADCYRIPLPILMNILKTLARAGMVDSVRGARGGYRLGMDPKDITLHMVVIAMEGPVRLFACAGEDGGVARSCEKADWCPISTTARTISDRLSDFLKGVTLTELTEGDRPQSQAIAINC